MRTSYFVQRLFDGQAWHDNVVVTVSEGKVVSLQADVSAEHTVLEGILVPGFIDAQVNGGGGFLFNHSPSVETLKAMMEAHAKFGVTSMLPTVITSKYETLRQAADAVAEAIRLKIPGIIGVHFEGPHISASKKGIHNSAYIRQLSSEELAIYQRQDLGIKLITVAPETVSNDIIAELVEAGVIVCIGHTNGSYEETKAALTAGARGFTHLYNAMSPLMSREPGAVGAALEDKHAWCGLILDGLHVHPAAAKIALNAKDNGKIFLVTDAMSTIGSDQRQFELDGRTICLRGNKLTDEQGTLAGSALNMVTAVNNAVALLGVSPDEAIKMASTYPAQFLGVSPLLGHIRVGSDANFVQLLSEPGRFIVSQSWYQGVPLLTE